MKLCIVPESRKVIFDVVENNKTFPGAKFAFLIVRYERFDRAFGKGRIVSIEERNRYWGIVWSIPLIVIVDISDC